MFGFEYYSPTKVIFGKGTENQAGELVKAYGAKKVLIPLWRQKCCEIRSD